MAFYGVVLIKKLTSQQVKCSSGPVLVEFIGLPMFLFYLKQLA